MFELLKTFGLTLLIILARESHQEQNIIPHEYSLQDIEQRVRESCVLVGTQPLNISTVELLANLSKVFNNEPRVAVGIFVEDKKHPGTAEGLIWSNKANYGGIMDDLAFYPKRDTDRKCLLRPPVLALRAQRYNGTLTPESVLNFLNSKCGTLRQLDGSISPVGKSIESILENVFHVGEDRNYSEEDKWWNGQEGLVNIGATCDRIAMPSREHFFHSFLFRSKPVIITDALKSWPAIYKWTNDFLISKFGKNEVRVAFVPNGEYEGCDKANKYEDYKDFKFPEEVKKQLSFPDLVVVRPAFMNIKFSYFMSFLENTQNSPTQASNISAYLEYSSIPSHFPELERDVEEMPFVAGVLKRRHLNIWLSNGNTLGKLHFDPFDNFLSQISGRKQVLLYEPHDNTRLYEAHIQEAMLGYSATRKEFRRKKLLDSTSMVMSPINILQPDYNRFPKFKGVQAMNCTISEGEVLYMPSYWWHEVQSYPSDYEARNLAVNYWYEPFLTKEYPCESCKMDVNTFYHHLLD